MTHRVLWTSAPPRAPRVVPAGRSVPPPRLAVPRASRMVSTAATTGACKGCKSGEEPFVSMPTGGGGRDGIALEPFPRQVLVGNASGPVVYLGPIYDATHWKSIAWWFEIYAGLLGTAGAPATAYLDTSEHMNGPWTEMIPGGEAGAIGAIDTGAVMNPSRYVRAAISVRASETTAVALRIVARKR